MTVLRRYPVRGGEVVCAESAGWTPEELARQDAADLMLDQALASFKAHGVCWNSPPEHRHPLDETGACTVKGCRGPGSGLEPPSPLPDPLPCVDCQEPTSNRYGCGIRIVRMGHFAFEGFIYRCPPCEARRIAV